MLIHRRKFLVGLVAAPAIVRFQNIMPVRSFVTELDSYDDFIRVVSECLTDWVSAEKYRLSVAEALYKEALLVKVTK